MVSADVLRAALILVKPPDLSSPPSSPPPHQLEHVFGKQLYCSDRRGYTKNTKQHFIDWALLSKEFLKRPQQKGPIDRLLSILNDHYLSAAVLLPALIHLSIAACISDVGHAILGFSQVVFAIGCSFGHRVWVSFLPALDGLVMNYTGVVAVVSSSILFIFLCAGWAVAAAGWAVAYQEHRLLGSICLIGILTTISCIKLQTLETLGMGSLLFTLVLGMLIASSISRIICHQKIPSSSV